MEREAVFASTNEAEADQHKECPVKGYDFNTFPFDFPSFLNSFKSTGFTASSLGRAIEEVNRMRDWRDPVDPSLRCKIFLGYTSNMVSSGNRDIIRFLVQHKLVDVLVSSAGGIEEDFIKCLADTFVLRGSCEGAELRRAGLNRIGNLMVPNENYCKFEDWVMPILKELEGQTLCPSDMIRILGSKINDESSIYYWAAKNNVPVYCPALTDGSLGDMLYFHSFKCAKPIVLDIIQDVRSINMQAVRAPATGMLILGGGVVKHHIANANLMRNGADFAVYINTGHEFDGSDAGASPDEAVSWGKIKVAAEPVKVSCDATIAFPLLVAGTFGRDFEGRRSELCKELSEQLYL